MTADEIAIAPADVNDVPLILAFIRELAEYERLASSAVVTAESLEQSLFGPMPQAEVVIARCGDVPAGFALFFHNYSTFLGRRGLWLEDLFVRPAFRGQGIGLTLLRHLATLAVERGCGRFEWAVLDWNEPAIGFYQRLGAIPMSDWTVYRLTGESLARLASRADA
ncbi:MAG: GNAT family N-acetyltransferase [Gemmatimonadales bacterium]|nr:GNAT family N-acetyltransferase [Gemmatimonadales bacterium]